ncbi:MAG: aminopeptidase [Promethearchaeota archaeon]|nr:MAG: aminopeptidase [Candidatus Lokiarchaeota archaeon]
MINLFYEKLAKLAINFSTNVKKGDRVFISGPALAKDLFQALYVEVIKSGGYPLLNPGIEGTQELKYKYASEEQLQYVDPIMKMVIKEFDAVIDILGDYNTRKLSMVDTKKISKAMGSPSNREIWEILMKRMGTREFKYLALPFPCNSLAQEANMDLFSYFEFIEKALYLDKDEPIEEWLEIERKQEKITDYLNKIEKIHILGEDTDLTMSTKGRIWENNCGRFNLPDGEVCTSPVEESVNGHIRFTYPGIYQGNEVQNIYLEFKDGKVINYSADKGNELLKEILQIENAEILGEFAIGTNYNITKFTKEMLFDEKMGGTIHCALGAGFKDLGSKNDSAIHWDILKDMKVLGSKIIADTKIIYEEGNWKI